MPSEQAFLETIPALAKSVSTGCAAELLTALEIRLTSGAAEMVKSLDRYVANVREPLLDWILSAIFGRLPVIMPGSHPSDASLRIEWLVTERKKTLDSQEDHDATFEIISAVLRADNAYRKERLRQARTSYNVAIALATIGVLITFAGVASLLAGYVEAGMIAAGSGGIAEIVSALSFLMYREANDRLEKVAYDLARIEAVKVGLTLVDKIGDPAKKDEAILTLIETATAHKSQAADEAEGRELHT